jgi:hypothetical protein
MNKWPKALEADLRGHLGKYEISGNDALKPLKFTSGGQKSRVAFACLTYAKPHVVILGKNNIIIIFIHILYFISPEDYCVLKQYNIIYLIFISSIFKTSRHLGKAIIYLFTYFHLFYPYFFKL